MDKYDKIKQVIIDKSREYFSQKGVNKFELEAIKNRTGLTDEEFYSVVKTKEELIELVLKEERLSFSNIFEEYDFDGMNAIDILLIVAMEMYKRFYYINPTITYQIKDEFPELYQQHLKEKLDFIHSMLSINVEKGMSQGIYRNDVSKELITRLWLSKIVDLHNPKEFPNEEISYPILFEQSIESFIMSAANEEGIEYYKRRKQLMSFLNFNKKRSDIQR